MQYRIIMIYFEENFMVFSSVAALFGNIRQANYTASNAYIDTLIRDEKTPASRRKNYFSLMISKHRYSRE